IRCEGRASIRRRARCCATGRKDDADPGDWPLDRAIRRDAPRRAGCVSGERPVSARPRRSFGRVAAMESLRGDAYLDRSPERKKILTHSYLKSPIGTLLIAGDDEAIRMIFFPKKGAPPQPHPDWNQFSRGLIADASQQLREYFAGRRTDFDLPLRP